MRITFETTVENKKKTDKLAWEYNTNHIVYYYLLFKNTEHIST